MAQDTATQDNVTGTADVGVAAGLADPQYGYANLNTIFDIAIDSPQVNLFDQHHLPHFTIHLKYT